jgi:hypothetical protein
MPDGPPFILVTVIMQGHHRISALVKISFVNVVMIANRNCDVMTAVLFQQQDPITKVSADGMITRAAKDSFEIQFCVLGVFHKLSERIADGFLSVRPDTFQVAQKGPGQRYPRHCGF